MVAKCLVYDDDYFTLPSAAAPAPDAVPEDGLASQGDDLAPLLELPNPDVVSGETSSTSVVSAAVDDALTASADSCVTEVGGDRGIKALCADPSPCLLGVFAVLLSEFVSFSSEFVVLGFEHLKYEIHADRE